MFIKELKKEELEKSYFKFIYDYNLEINSEKILIKNKYNITFDKEVSKNFKELDPNFITCFKEVVIRDSSDDKEVYYVIVFLDSKGNLFELSFDITEVNYLFQDNNIKDFLPSCFIYREFNYHKEYSVGLDKETHKITENTQKVLDLFLKKMLSENNLSILNLLNSKIKIFK